MRTSVVLIIIAGILISLLPFYIAAQIIEAARKPENDKD